MWQIPGERITLDLDGPTVTVERIRSWSVQFEGLTLVKRYLETDNQQAEYIALAAMCDFTVREALPQWDIADHHGYIPVSGSGMTRLPIRLLLQIIDQWLASYILPEAEKPANAVDAVIPPSPARNEIKRRLRSVKAAA